MAGTSIVISNWFRTLAKKPIMLIIMIMIVLYTAYVLFNRSNKYSNKKKISQSVVCLFSILLILILGNREQSVPKDAHIIAGKDISNDLDNNMIPLTWFFKQKNKEILYYSSVPSIDAKIAEIGFNLKDICGLEDIIGRGRYEVKDIAEVFLQLEGELEKYNWLH